MWWFLCILLPQPCHCLFHTVKAITTTTLNQMMKHSRPVHLLSPCKLKLQETLIYHLPSPMCQKHLISKVYTPTNGTAKLNLFWGMISLPLFVGGSDRHSPKWWFRAHPTTLSASVGKAQTKLWFSSECYLLWCNGKSDQACIITSETTIYTGNKRSCKSNVHQKTSWKPSEKVWFMNRIILMSVRFSPSKSTFDSSGHSILWSSRTWNITVKFISAAFLTWKYKSCQ